MNRFSLRNFGQFYIYQGLLHTIFQEYLKEQLVIAYFGLNFD